MVTARLACKRAMEWANSCPGCINRPRKRYSHLLECLLLTGKAAWALSRYLPTENSDYYMLVNEWAWLRSQVCFKSALGFSFRVRVQTEIKTWCAKGMHL